LKPWQFGGLRAIWFGQHLYEPLLHLAGSAVEVSPVPLNLGERHFLDDLRTYFDKSPSLLKDRELYLLRNMSKGRGVGFFELVIFTRTSSFGYLLKESSTFHSSIPRASGIWALPTQQW
jgi:hypothetical protein